MKELLIYERMAQLLHGVLFLQSTESTKKSVILCCHLGRPGFLCFSATGTYCACGWANAIAKASSDCFQIFWPSGCCFFFRKKSLLQLPAGGIPTCWKCEGMVARRFLGDEVLSYLHNMLLPETVGSNRDPLLAMSWFRWWLLAEEHPKSNLQLLFVTKFWKMLCEVYALRSQPPGAITVSPEGRVQAGRENFRTVVEQKLNNRNGQLQMVHLWLNQIKMRPFLSL